MAGNPPGISNILQPHDGGVPLCLKKECLKRDKLMRKQENKQENKKLKQNEHAVN